MCESENTAPDAQSIYFSLENLSLDLSHIQAFCSDGASVMTGKKGGIAAMFQKDEQCENILNIYCICHWLALVCSDTGDKLKFLKDFELTMLQLWSFFKNSPKCLKVYIKVAMQIKMFFDLPKKQPKKTGKKSKEGLSDKVLKLSVDTVYCEIPGLLKL